MTRLDMTPLFRTGIGFDRFADLMDSAFQLEEKALSYPPYNIARLSEDDYAISMAVAGFREEDLDIVVKENTLTVSGKTTQAEEDKNTTYLHKGIATRSFERKFSLADHVQVIGASLDHGILRIELKREVPEAAKPRRIDIANGGTKKVIEQKQAA